MRQPYFCFTMTLRKKAKTLYQTASEKLGHKGEEAVYRYYIGEAIKECEGREDAFFSVSHYFQAYNKDKRAALNKKKMSHARISAEEIPAVTQLFTPPHLAEYIIQNSLGRYLYECGISLDLPYADGLRPEDFGKRKKDIREIRILDPAAGTGNLIYPAARLMKKAYLKLGYGEGEVKGLLATNFIGLDIDGRASELAKFLLKREFGADFDIVTLKSFEPSSIENYKKWKGVYEGLLLLGERGTVSIFPQKEVEEIQKSFSDGADGGVLKTFSIFNSKYDIILMNPPYLASSDCGKGLLGFIKKHFADYKADLFAVFIARCLGMLDKGGYMGVVCPFNWMFTRQFGGLRRLILSSSDIMNLAMLPADDYKEAVVYLSCFVVSGKKEGVKGSYIKIEKGADSNQALINGGKRYMVDASRYQNTPYNGIMFWVSQRFIDNYRSGRLADVLEIRQGLATGNNKKYLKKINEVPAGELVADAVSIEDFDNKGGVYAPYNKGGQYRKWFGNIEYAIRFDKHAREELSKSGNRLPSRAYYFKPCVTWTLVSSKGHFGARLSSGSLFDVGGSCGFPKKEGDIYVILGFLCSVVATAYLNAQNPTINCQVGDIKNLPYIEPSDGQRARIERLVKENVEIARADWFGEVSAESAKENFLKMKRNEEELNEIFIKIYGLEGELSPDVPDRLITLKYK